MDPVQAFMQANALAIPLYPPTSRYYGVATAQLTRPDGTAVAYLRRRFVPPPENFVLLLEHVVAAGDRIDNLAAQHLGDPLQYWRICDANRAMDPAALAATPGDRVRITLPAGVPGIPDAR